MQITTQDKVQDGRDNPLYATHEVEFSADVLAEASNVQITPQAGVTVLRPGKNGQGVDLVDPGSAQPHDQRLLGAGQRVTRDPRARRRRR